MPRRNADPGPGHAGVRYREHQNPVLGSSVGATSQSREESSLSPQPSEIQGKAESPDLEGSKPPERPHPISTARTCAERGSQRKTGQVESRHASSAEDEDLLNVGREHPPGRCSGGEERHGGSCQTEYR